MSKTLFLKPRLTEQTYALAQHDRLYVFDIPKDVNKQTLAKAVAAQFEVTVTSVNMTNIKGKAKRTISINGRRRSNASGTRDDTKKAYVKLAEGFSLPVFAAVEDEEKKEQAVQKQVDKAVVKQAKDDIKPVKTPRRGLKLLGRKEHKV